MAAARPAVTTDVGSCRELLLGADDDFGPAGICVPVMHQSALAEAMLTLCSDAKLRRRMGENGRKRVFAHYRHDMMVRRYDEIFEEVRGSHYGGNRV
jgi:glycosyltransferase involved in cell wall biosynthesis